MSSAEMPEPKKVVAVAFDENTAPFAEALQHLVKLYNKGELGAAYFIVIPTSNSSETIIDLPTAETLHGIAMLSGFLHHAAQKLMVGAEQVARDQQALGFEDEIGGLMKGKKE